MRLACEVAADEKELGAYRPEAERQFGAERVSDAWPAVLDILGGARELELAVAADATGGRPAARTLDFDELQVEIAESGFYTFDYYTDGDELDLVGEFTARYREMATMLTSATLRGAPVVWTRCAGCATEILTNRPIGASLPCVRCDVSSHVAPLLGDGDGDLLEGIRQAVDMVEEPADGQGRCVVVQPWDPSTPEETRQVLEAARRHGLEPVPSYHPAILYGFMRGLASGQYAMRHPPIGAIYRFPAGRRHIPRMMPAPVEEYLTEVRQIFTCPVNTSSGHIDFTREDPEGLIYMDRLEDAAERAHDDPDVGRRQMTLVFLSQLQLARDQPEIALRHADEAVRLDGGDEDAWVARGTPNS